MNKDIFEFDAEPLGRDEMKLVNGGSAFAYDDTNHCDNGATCNSDSDCSSGCSCADHPGWGYKVCWP